MRRRGSYFSLDHLDQPARSVVRLDPIAMMRRRVMDPAPVVDCPSIGIDEIVGQLVVGLRPEIESGGDIHEARDLTPLGVEQGEKTAVGGDAVIVSLYGTAQR